MRWAGDRCRRLLLSGRHVISHLSAKKYEAKQPESSSRVRSAMGAPSLRVKKARRLWETRGSRPGWREGAEACASVSLSPASCGEKAARGQGLGRLNVQVPRAQLSVDTEARAATRGAAPGGAAAGRRPWPAA